MSSKKAAHTTKQKSTLFSFGFSKVQPPQPPQPIPVIPTTNNNDATPYQQNTNNNTNSSQNNNIQNISVKKDVNKTIIMLPETTNTSMEIIEDEDVIVTGTSQTTISTNTSSLLSTPPKISSLQQQQQQQQPKRTKVVIHSDDELEDEQELVLISSKNNKSSSNNTSSSAPTKTTSSTTNNKRPRPPTNSSSSSDSDDSSDEDEDDEDDDDDDNPPPKSSSSKKKSTTTTTTKPPSTKIQKLSTNSTSKSTTTSFSSNDNNTPSLPPSPPSNNTDEDKSTTTTTTTGLALRYGQHEHFTFPFLINPRDKEKRPPTHPEYDQTTLYIPEDFYSRGCGSKQGKISDAQQTWWKFYSDHFDCIVAFKVGKFYEMYNHCADVAVRVCGLAYMKGDQAHCGFPEVMWHENSLKLVEAGYRVARVEQTETPEQHKERTGKNNGQLRRELCSVLSRGTLMLTERDGKPSEDSRRQLLSISELDNRIGICIVDVTTGRFRVGDFEKDTNLVQLSSVLALEAPAEIVSCPTSLSESIIKLLKMETLALFTPLNKKRASQIIDVKGKLLDGGGGSSSISAAATTTTTSTSSSTTTTEQQQQLPSPNSTLSFIENLSPVARNALNLSLVVLNRALIADELVSMGRFERFEPMVVRPSSTSLSEPTTTTTNTTSLSATTHTSLDATALRHLEILTGNSLNGNTKGSVLAYLDRTFTPFGGRLMREWISKPLAQRDAIYYRVDGVTVLLHLLKENQLSNVINGLKKCPDLERALNRIHSIGSVKRATSHPDSRAVIYEAANVNASKIKLLADVVETFKSMSTMMDTLYKSIQSILSSDNNGLHLKNTSQQNIILDCIQSWLDPSLHACIRDMSNSIDLNQAKSHGTIEPRKGVSREYDEALAMVDSAKKELDNQLKKAKTVLKTNEVSYFGSGKHSYQLECRDSVVPPSNWSFTSQKKGYKRYTHDELQSAIEDLNHAQIQLDTASLTISRAVFTKFDSSRLIWSKAVFGLTQLDCLLSLALVARDGTEEEPMCIPEILTSNTSTTTTTHLDDEHQHQQQQQPCLKLYRSRHPCVARALEESGKSAFIPNDIILDKTTTDGTVLLLSGPNMGGKSTLLRQTCIAVLMAQIGSYVPAEKCEMTLVDRIFTRLGAHDRIMQGESTFFVELSEAAEVLKYATQHSLVILDELGRGTSTFDGTAIAHAVIEELVERKCRVIFATHYHELIREVAKKCVGGVSLGHMMCLAENKNVSLNNTAMSSSTSHDTSTSSTTNDNNDGMMMMEQQDITFLFKLAPGTSDKSYGLNVAKLARLPLSVIQRADEVSNLFENAFSRFIRQQLIVEIKQAIHDRNEDVVKKLMERAEILFF
jgi:DNA mismatch repair protein MSH6